MPDIFSYVMSVWFCFYLFNHSVIFAGLKSYLDSKIPWQVMYSLECAFCFTFHFTLLMVVFGERRWPELFTAPVLALFIELAYRRLTAEPQ